jgi:broad specificity phosphatase PhoE
MKKPILLFLVAALFSACSTTRIYIVRHGERLNSTDTTSLSAAGLVRAQDLAQLMTDKEIDSVFTSNYTRTRQTATPTAKRFGLTTVTYNPRPTEQIVNRLKQINGKNVLVVGHSDTILDIAKGLETKPQRQKIESLDFDNLLTVTIKRQFGNKKITLVESTYGKPTMP